MAERDAGATRAAVLGALSLPFGILGPFAIVSGSRSLHRIRGSGGTLSGEVSALFGLAAGVIATVLLVVGLAWFLLSGLL